MFPNCEIYGSDIGPSLIAFATKQAKKAIIFQHSGQVLPFPDKNYDVVCYFQLVEHLEKPESFLYEAHIILKN